MSAAFTFCGTALMPSLPSFGFQVKTAARKKRAGNLLVFMVLCIENEKKEEQIWI